MERPLIAGALLVAGAIAAIGLVGAWVVVTRPLYAVVVSVEPVTHPVTVKVQDCRDLRAARARAAQDPKRANGIVIGGMVGGVIEHRQGGARSLAAIAVPETGAAPRKALQRGARAEAPQGCRTVSRLEQRIHAYDVRYRLDGRLGTVRMEQAPGDRIPVVDGNLVLPPPLPKGKEEEA